jgi:hypothetical protein
VIYYHGTTSNFLPSILREGLKPNPAGQWRIKFENATYEPYKDDGKDYVCVTRFQYFAEMYANSKANYLRALPGTTVEANGNTLADFLKLPNAPLVEDAKPVLLEIHWTGETKKDPHTSTGVLICCNQVVPVSHIKQIPMSIPGTPEAKDIEIKASLAYLLGGI